MMNTMKLMNRPPMPDLMKTIKSLLPQRFRQAKRFVIFTKRSDSSAKGVILLLTILILAAMLSISISIFDSVLGEFRISGEITDSFTALYAADQGMEKMLYENRVSSEAWACPGRTGNCEYGPADSVPGDQLPAGACFKVRLERRGQNVTIVSSGEYNCLNRNPDENIGSVKRAFQSSYSVE